MYEDVIDLLKAHDYFRGISGAVLGEIASLAKVRSAGGGMAATRDGPHVSRIADSARPVFSL
jgi:hypothetical protein